MINPSRLVAAIHSLEGWQNSEAELRLHAVHRAGRLVREGRSELNALIEVAKWAGSSVRTIRAWQAVVVAHGAHETAAILHLAPPVRLHRYYITKRARSGWPKGFMP